MKKCFKQIISAVIALALIVSMGIVGIFGASAEKSDYGCKEAFSNFYQELFENDTENNFWNEYNTKNYYSDENMEATPDFMLVSCSTLLNFSVTSIILGDYVITVAAEAYPYSLGIYVYTPTDGEIRTLTEAYVDDVKGVRNMIETYDVEYANVRRIGDVDKDENLNIKDATLIQKKLAGIVELNDDIVGIRFNDINSTGACYSYADFNRDEKVNIKDATAIQKHLAKMDY